MGEDEANAFIEQLLRCACRIVVRIEQSGILGRTKLDPGFLTLVMDHEQDREEATDRLNTMRVACKV